MILVHELGHLIVAKRVRIMVHTFAIGFGPRLLAVTRGETTYALNLLPIGGYVNMAGEDFAEDKNPASAGDGRGGAVPPQGAVPGESRGGRAPGGWAGPGVELFLAGGL